MDTVPFPLDYLRLGHALPVSLRDKQGRLLLARGTVVQSEKLYAELRARELFVESAESLWFNRVYAGKLDELVRKNASLGQIARLKVETGEVIGDHEVVETPQDPLSYWLDFVTKLHLLLNDPPAHGFKEKLLRLAASFHQHITQDPDGSLLILIQTKLGEHRHYSATHSTLVALITDQAAQKLPGLTQEHRHSLRLAALTMNVAMTGLQDRLSQQADPLSLRQRDQINQHPQMGEALLRSLFIDDELWLEAVRLHHDNTGGPLHEISMGAQMGRIIQRADVFCARLSARAKRRGLSATAAAQAAYLDKQGKADEAGSAIIKGVGLYPPGTFVSLANNEVAVVLRRGFRANSPMVASVIGRDGLAMGSPTLRDTRTAAHQVKTSIPAHQVKIRLNLEKLLALK